MLSNLFNQSNWLAIIIGAVAYFALGAIWYGLLGKTWMSATGLTKEKVAAGSKIIYLYTFILEFIVCMAMSTVMSAMVISEISEAIQFGIIVGLIFSGLTTIVHYMYTYQNKNLYWIDAGYTTIASIVVAVILTVV